MRFHSAYSAQLVVFLYQLILLTFEQTGRPIIQDGRLTGHQIEQGQIEIEGSGLDTSNTNYTQILSQAAKINAGVWAKELKVVAGKNNISHEGVIATTASNELPLAVAIDTQALGGMYADKILLISTQQNAEIQNAGQIWAMAGGVSLNAEGKLVNSGSIVSSEKPNSTQGAASNKEHSTIAIKTNEINNSGQLSSQGRTSGATDL